MEQLPPPAPYQNTARPPKNKGSTGLKFLLAFFILVALAGWGAFYYVKFYQKPNKTSTDAITLATASPSPSPSATPAAGRAINGFTENAAAALNTMNTAYFADLMADEVRVTLAASEGLGSRTASQAVADLDYLKSAVAPWNFALSSSLTDSWRTGNYAIYLNDADYIGQASSGEVVAFTLNSDNKINAIFIAPNPSLL